MEEAWKTLAAFGLPDGAPRPKPAHIDFAAIRTALSLIDATALTDSEGVILLAWLEGWRHHWPSRFEHELGHAGETLRTALSARSGDANRFLKLRRIAVENLAGVL